MISCNCGHDWNLSQPAQPLSHAIFKSPLQEGNYTTVLPVTAILGFLLVNVGFDRSRESQTPNHQVAKETLTETFFVLLLEWGNLGSLTLDLTHVSCLHSAMLLWPGPWRTMTDI